MLVPIAATMLTLQFVEQGFNYQFFSDYGAYLLAQNKITLEKKYKLMHLSDIH